VDMPEGHMMHCMTVFLLFDDPFHGDIRLYQTALVDLDPQPILPRPLRPLANYKIFDPFEDRGSKRYNNHLHRPIVFSPSEYGFPLSMFTSIVIASHPFIADSSCICENGALERGHCHRSKALDGWNQYHLAYQNHGCCGTSDHEHEKYRWDASLNP
jgi:hypothetical protein